MNFFLKPKNLFIGFIISLSSIQAGETFTEYETDQYFSKETAVELEKRNFNYNIERSGSQETWFKFKMQKNEYAVLRVTSHVNSGSMNITCYNDKSSNIASMYYLKNNKTQRAVINGVYNGMYFCKISETAGNIDINLLNSWKNPNVKDSDRSDYSNYYLARYFISGKYIKNNEEYYLRFLAKKESAINITFKPYITDGNYMSIFILDQFGNIITKYYYLKDGSVKSFNVKLHKDGIYFVKINGAKGQFEISSKDIMPNKDSDNDGLTDIQEFYHQTNAKEADSDGDGIDDYSELYEGKEPRINKEYTLTAEKLSNSFSKAKAIKLNKRNIIYNIENNKTKELWLKFDAKKGENLILYAKAYINTGYINVKLYNKDSKSAIKSLYYLKNKKYQILEFKIDKSGGYYLKVEGEKGNLDLAVIDSWMNVGIDDKQRFLYTTKSLSKYLASGNYDLQAYKTLVFRFIGKKNDNFSLEIKPHLNYGNLNVYLEDEKGNQIKSLYYVKDGQDKTFDVTFARTGIYYLKIDGSRGNFDLLVDGYEENKDTDNDGLTDIQELFYKTDINFDDSDNDGISDILELSNGLDPRNPNDPVYDDDNDGIINKIEIKYGLNPQDPKDAKQDFDNDGYSNIVEIEAKTNPNDSSSKPDQAYYLKKFVTRFYNVMLDRQPDEGGLKYWVNKLSTNELVGADLARNFIYSKEFQNKKYDDTKYLEKLYRAFFDREPDLEGIKYWLHNMQIEGMSRDGVLDGFLTSHEFETLCKKYNIKPINELYEFVRRFYRVVLNRNAEPEGLNYWINELKEKRKSGADIAKNFILSKEFQSFKLDNITYLKVLYRTFFNRFADEGGLNYWLGRMNKGDSRELILNEFLNSKEFKQICKRFGIEPFFDSDNNENGGNNNNDDNSDNGNNNQDDEDNGGDSDSSGNQDDNSDTIK